MQEKYVPSTEEIQKAENTMSPKQIEGSRLRQKNVAELAQLDRRPKEKDPFDPETFDKLKSALGITLPFQISKQFHESSDSWPANYIGYSLYLPTPEGYYYYSDNSAEDSLDHYFYVSKQPPEEGSMPRVAGGGYYDNRVRQGHFMEREVWMEEYDPKEVSEQEDLLHEAVTTMLGNDQNGRISFQNPNGRGVNKGANIEEVLEWIKNKSR